MSQLKPIWSLSFSTGVPPSLVSSLEQENPSILAEAGFLSQEVQLGFALSGVQILTCVLAQDLPKLS